MYRGKNQLVLSSSLLHLASPKTTVSSWYSITPHLCSPCLSCWYDLVEHYIKKYVRKHILFEEREQKVQTALYNSPTLSTICYPSNVHVTCEFSEV